MPGPGDENLGEVERALSVLQGRHPEHERVRREDAAKQAILRATREKAASTAHGQFVRRRLVVLALSVVALAVVVALAFAGQRFLARRAELARIAFPGWELVEAAHGALAAKVAPGCLLLASTQGTDVSLVLEGEEHHGASPLLACACVPAVVTATTTGGGGVVLLRAEAREIGGSRAFSVENVDARTKVTTDAACSESSFDAWLDAKGHRTPRPEGPAPVGFRPLAHVADRDFAVVDVPASSCLLVQGSAYLRLRGGGTPVHGAHGDAAWCTTDAPTITLRDGPGSAFVAPMNEVGGINGMLEIASGLARVGTTSRAADARAFLLASAVPESLVTTASPPDLGPVDDARIVAVSADVADAFSPETATDVFSYCHRNLCMFSGAQRWHTTATAEGAIARARAPFWLYGLKDAVEPGALKAGVDLLSFARRLRRQGFEPTTIEALTETEKGIEVLGRANEDAIVAVTLLGSAPWITTYTDGPAWSIDGAPRIVSLAPLARTSLVARTRLPPKATRHSVVFRRRAL